MSTGQGCLLECDSDSRRDEKLAIEGCAGETASACSGGLEVRWPHS